MEQNSSTEVKKSPSNALSNLPPLPTFQEGEGEDEDEDEDRPLQRVRVEEFYLRVVEYLKEGDTA